MFFYPPLCPVVPVVPPAPDLLSPVSLLFVVGFLFGLAGPQLKNRRQMMGCKFMGDSMMGLYLLIVGGTSGGCGALIAATGAFIQAMTPLHYLHKTVWIRIGAAVILSAISIYFVYKTPLDILPLSMVVICRFGELQSKAQHIRYVYFVTSFPWMLYHFLNGFYLPLIYISIGAVSLLVSILRHHRRVYSAAVPPTSEA